MTRRVGIVGVRPPRASAPLSDFDLFHELLADVREFVDALPDDAVVVSGGAEGVDSYAVSYARGARRLVVVEHLPRAEDGDDRFFARNQRIVDDGLTELAAFVAPWARGTWDTVRRAKAAGVPTTIVRRPRNWTVVSAEARTLRLPGVR